MTKADDDIIETAKERFRRSVERNTHNVKNMRQDIRFAAASPDDPWQWEEQDKIARKGRPMLTINKMPQHLRQVTNDIRQNRPSVKYRPMDDKADPEVAEILMGMVRHIESISDADVAYSTVADHQVGHGLGYLRVSTDYVNETSFDQDIFIGAMVDWDKCHDDPDAKEPAGGDRKWFFCEEKLTEDEFKEKYPKAEAIDWSYARDIDGWFGDDKSVRIVEYFEIVEKSAKLIEWDTGATSYEGDPVPPGALAPIDDRTSTRKEVIWRKLNGQEVLEEKAFPGKHIPFARVIGNLWYVDGKPHISGLVRNAKDSQRMFNVAQSAIVERVLLAPKAPWVTPAEAITGHERTWQTANTANHAYLPYNHVDENGDPIPSPHRTDPATVEPGLQQVAMSASDDIKSETGQYDASLGQKSNETSGRAIMARQREGDMATFHYVDNLRVAVKHVGRIILGMIPTVYDRKRVARIIGEDDAQDKATLDPKHPAAFQKFKDDQGAMQRVFNPTIGTYDVDVSTGPSFSTRRVEAVEAMTQLTQANPALWQSIGDLLVKNMDWPGADEMSKRLKLTLLPEIQQEIQNEDEEQAIPPQVQMAMEQMQQQLHQVGDALGKAGEEVEKLELELAEKDHAMREEEMRTLEAVFASKQAKFEQQMQAREQQAMERVSALMSEAPQSTPQPAQQAPMVMPDMGYSINRELAPVLQGIQELMQRNEALIQAFSKPRQSTVQITKQADGSFVGTKTEA